MIGRIAEGIARKARLLEAAFAMAHARWSRDRLDVAEKLASDGAYEAWTRREREAYQRFAALMDRRAS